MLNEELKTNIAERIPGAVFDETGAWLSMEIEPSSWHSLAQHLYQEENLYFDFLFCVTGVDWKTHLGMVYHLTSTRHRHTLVVKAKLDKSNAVIESVSDIWATANFHEREAFEMFGVEFSGHPDLRLLILPDGWEGKFPMRKDFEDPVNMIRL